MGIPFPLKPAVVSEIIVTFVPEFVLLLKTPFAYNPPAAKD